MTIVSNLALHFSPTIDRCVHVLYVVNGRNAMAAQKLHLFSILLAMMMMLISQMLLSGPQAQVARYG